MFKTFNDNHGYEASDIVLRALAERMVAVMLDDAVCVRTGGEEFALPLPKADLDEAVARAERLRSDVAAIEVRIALGPLPCVTISSGVVAYTGNSTPPSVLMKCADEALCVAKAGEGASASKSQNPSLPKLCRRRIAELTPGHWF
nr:GGDEF domain-containing protein [Octadecabacter antarcticus]